MPTTNATYTLKRFPPQEFQRAEIRNISSMDYYPEIGIGPVRQWQQITGVISSNFLLYMATTLFARWPSTICNPRNQLRHMQHLLRWLANFQIHWRLLGHRESSAKSGSISITCLSAMQSKHFKLFKEAQHPAPDLLKAPDLATVSQIYSNSCNAIHRLSIQKMKPASAGCVCV